METCQKRFSRYSFLFAQFYSAKNQVTAKDGDRDRPENIVYFLDIATEMFEVNRTTGWISVLKVIKVLYIP